MTTGRRLLLPCLTVTLVVASHLLLVARQSGPGPAPAATGALTDTIPVDPLITAGQFDNGLRYYIRANDEPENRAELRLVVNAGSVLEEDDQLGLAHFVEHMAFNGTENFPKMDLVNFVESIGMRFGNDLNAYTSFDETVYMLEVPTDDPEVLDRAMLILEDWAQNVSFDPDEVDRERGVVLEEWRLRRGAAARMRDEQLPVLLKGSRYAERLPIGTPEVLQNFTHDRLVEFYTDWYRPDLMGVVAVGDFDPAAMETLIREHFASIPAAEAPKSRPRYEVPGRPGTDYAIATDPEAGQTRVTVYNTMAARDQTTIGAYRQQLIVERLFTGMLNARFAEIAQQPGAPFLGAGAGRGLLVRTTEATTLAAVVRDGELEEGLRAILAEAERVVRFGFTEAEFERQKANTMRAFERALDERENQRSGSLADEYIRNFTTDEPIPGIVYEGELYRRFMPEITLDEVNALAARWSADGNRVVEVSAPEKDGVPLPSAARLAEVMAEGAASELAAYEDSVGMQPLLDEVPEAGSIVETAELEDFGITQWTLSNGITVVLKPTDFRQDEILVRAFSPGGTSLASDEDFVAADTAGQVVGAGGLGEFSAIDLRKVLAGKAASAGVSIGDYFEELSGSASPKDIETLFEQIYLRFTQPRADPEIFSVMTDQMRTALANQRSRPEFAFNEALSEALWQDHLRAAPMTLERVDQMDLDKSFAFYKERLADAGDFTFVFVGNIDETVLRPLVERYLASLPSTGRNESWRDVGLRPALGVVNRRVEKGIEPQSQTRIVFSGGFRYDVEHRVMIRAMSMALEGTLRNVLREDLGGTYGVSVSATSSKVPIPQYRVSISFGSDPDRTEALVRTVFEKIEELKEYGPSREDVESIKTIFEREYETNSRQNGYLLREIARQYQFEGDLEDVFELPRIYDRVNPPAIRRAAELYFDTGNYVKVELFPEQ